MCVKFRNLIMGPVKPYPLGATLARSPRQASEVAERGSGVHPLGGPEQASGGRLQSLPLCLFQECHVEVAVILLPPLVLLDGEGANEPHVPPYVIFHDATLADIARKRPKNSNDLKDVSGVGQSKIQRYGAAVLELVREHRAIPDPRVNTSRKLGTA